MERITRVRRNRSGTGPATTKVVGPPGTTGAVTGRSLLAMSDDEVIDAFRECRTECRARDGGRRYFRKVRRQVGRMVRAGGRSRLRWVTPVCRVIVVLSLIYLFVEGLQHSLPMDADPPLSGGYLEYVQAIIVGNLEAYYGTVPMAPALYVLIVASVLVSGVSKVVSTVREDRWRYRLMVLFCGNAVPLEDVKSARSKVRRDGVEAFLSGYSASGRGGSGGGDDD